MGHALVTGCSSGIGLATAKTLLRSGWSVTGLSRHRPRIGIDSVHDAHSASVSADFHWLPADLADVDKIADVLSPIDPVDAIIHAAGVQTTAFLGDLHPNEFRRMLALHVEAPAQIINILAERISDGGRIVLIGSRTMVGVAGKSQYSASKSALSGLCRSLAIEFASRRVTCNVLAPGPTDTPMLRAPSRGSVPPKIPALGKLVDPADVAALVDFLLGPHGSSITGQTLTICGGASLGV